MLRQDRNALEGMPLRLLLVTLMICLATPILFDSLVNFQKVSGSTIMQGQVDKVHKAALEVCNQGPGSQRIVKVEMPAEDCSLIIGGRSRSESMSLGFLLAGQEPVRTYLTDPNIRFVTCDNATISIHGAQVITLRCVNDAEGFAVEVRL
ncbi:MAG: hypothetical protein A4E32_02130 [Methanomassiliicoccales archaeon PtaU1.Bin124]|nr:MAG: hypothetical protein A4E32_02130 [Methanomassiliicoccales archaeon PtaU1.Bin124]